MQVILLSSPRLAPYTTETPAYDVRICGRWSELRAMAPTLAPSTVVVIDCGSRATADRLPGPVRRLLGEHPSISLVAALAMEDRPSFEIAALVKSGVADILDLDLETSAVQAARRFREARGRPFRLAVEEALPSELSGDARVLLRGAVDVALRGGGAAELAALFGVSPVTIAKWCTAAGLPFPRTLQLWMRLLLAAFLLGEPRRTAASVATLCGYGSDRSLRRALGRMTGGSPRTFRRADAFGTVARAFDAALFAVREEQRARQRR